MIGIVAISENWVIGNNNKLPWPVINDDLKFFRELTLNNLVLMGRKTWSSLYKPYLENRIIFVLTSDISEPKFKQYNNNTAWIKVNSENELEDKIAKLKSNKKLFICGGSSVYKEFLPKCNELYLTWVKGDYNGNILFPFTIAELHQMFPRSDKLVKELGHGHQVIRYLK